MIRVEKAMQYSPARVLASCGETRRWLAYSVLSAIREAGYEKFLASAFCSLALGGLTTQGQSGRRVQIINHSSSSIEYLHASNTERRIWEQDLPGPLRVILPGHFIDADIDSSWTAGKPCDQTSTCAPTSPGL